nr:putative integron gene cassette protein [uncultured bacterium]
MKVVRKFISTSSLILVAIGISTVAIAVLFTFPTDPLTWQVASWTLVAALVGLLILVLVSGYVLAVNRAARTWQRITSFLIGPACLAAVAVGSL